MVSAPIGITSAPISGLGPRVIAQVAAEAETHGFTSAWVAEANAGESFLTLGAVARATEQVVLGTGIVPIQLRTPPLLAMSIATLLAIEPERAINVGLGFSSPAVVQRWHGAAYTSRPIAQMREFITLLRACLSGDKVTFHGDFYQVDGFRLGIPVDPTRVRVILAALNPQMLTLGGQLADGVLLNYLPLSQVDWAVQRVRDGGSAPVYSYIHCGVGNASEVMAGFRAEVFGYLTVDAYANIFRRGGYGSVVDQTRRLWADGDRAGALEAIPLELVEQIKCVGTEEEVRARLAAYVDAGIAGPVLFPLSYGADPAASISAVVRALGPGT